MTKLQIKVNEPEFDKGDPWGPDKLNRKACAETLTRLLEEQTAALTISLNGEWGSGKTYLLTRWRQQLKNEDYTAIYFNAWEDDFLDDPLAAIIGQLWIELDCKRYEDELTGKLKDIKETIIPFFKRNWKAGLQTIACDLIQHTSGIDPEKLKDLEKTAECSVCDDYIELCRTRNVLDIKLTDLANSIYNRKLLDDNGDVKKGEDGKDLIAQKPLVFIIDELDRCRPTFAIEVLERVKHLFHIDHMIFVLGIDRKQLGNSIQAVYGNIDVNNYLHRFIDLDFAIPAADPEKFFEVLWERYEIPQHLADKVEVSPAHKIDSEEADTFKQISCAICLWYHFSLREIEQYLKLYVLLLRSTEPHHFSWPHLAPILILLKLKDANLYQKYLSHRCSVVDIVDPIMDASIKSRNDWPREVIPAVIYSTFMSEHRLTSMGTAISNIIQAIEDGTSIDEMPHVAKCLKNRNQEDLRRFVEIMNRMQNTFGEKSEYRSETLRMLAKKIDLVMTGVEDRR